MKQGIYEEIINKQILSKLNDISTEEFLIEKSKIDVEEARKFLWLPDISN